MINWDIYEKETYKRRNNFKRKIQSMKDNK